MNQFFVYFQKRFLKLFFLIWISCVSIATGFGQSSINTMSQVNSLVDDVVFRALLEVDMQKAIEVNLASKSSFIPLCHYIDYNVLGRGHVLRIDSDKLKDFVVHQTNEGATENELALNLLKSFENGEFNYGANYKNETSPEKAKVVLGGFFVTEFEYHQEKDGSYHTPLEINQTRIYISSDINSADKKNRVSFLGEWNPVPEEVIHQIDEVRFTKDKQDIIISSPGSEEPEGGIAEIINFERLYVKIDNVADSKINLTVGQFRNPFGIWSDYTSHGNFTSAKNNQLVNGFALKKIDLGIKLDMKLENGFEWQAAIMHGRLSRTNNLSREDNDDLKDFCGRVGYDKRNLSFGASGYFAELNSQRTALGVDFLVKLNKLSVSGELVYQNNREPEKIFETPLSIRNTSSVSSYVQLDYILTKRFHIYGMYERWDFNVNNTSVYDPEYKLFQGVRYNINNSLRWTIAEFGLMVSKDYGAGTHHLSTQLELLF